MRTAKGERDVRIGTPTRMPGCRRPGPGRTASHYRSTLEPAGVVGGPRQRPRGAAAGSFGARTARMYLSRRSDR